MANEEVIEIKPAFEDARGVIANILEKPITHVAIITSKKGSVRANHYHPKQVQYEFLVNGEYESTTKDLNEGSDGKIEQRTIKANSLVITQPMIAHAMHFKEDSVMLNLTDGQRDEENFEEHTKKYELINKEGNVTNNGE